MQVGVPIAVVGRATHFRKDRARIQGLSGSQGVLIPAANVEDLMLREDILDAVAMGKFHLWPVSKIEEGIEILTGTAAGSRNGATKFEEGSVFGRIDEKLESMARLMRDYE